MIRVKLIIDELNDLEANITRKKGEVFEVTEARARILAGDNKDGIVAVDILEVIPDVTVQEEKSIIKEDTPKKVTKRTSTKKTIEKDK